ncbi:DUF418 domain-containing protein [Bacillus sp. RAR_GA_16]|uniref:DUF418 domain-containing protein n=1 Tax=Bacillus sp. RAR_GA_16 TaxID=2876774 RepID=UPI001CC92ADF|nr:DUF418 domain-containing protein [Bacillus sp. RAR_GA_16]MCA0171448.1 DUF418 domain-containing protein [Bacillus sp. RAR_GA_16]
MIKSTAIPTPTNERILSIDAMRGLALLGIFFVNMVDFHSPWMYIDQLSYWGDQWNQFAMKIIDVLAQASFYPLFSFLFGYGFIILRNRLTARQVPFLPMMVRRLVILFLFGVIHFVFIWHGDILFTYSLCGLLLLAFIKLNGKQLLQIGLGLWLFYAIVFFLLLLPFGSEEFTSQHPEAIQQSLLVYGSGSYVEILNQRLSDWTYVNGGINGVLLIFSIFPYFLIGAAFAKEGWFNGEVKNLPLVRRLLFVGAIGFVVKLLPFLFNSYAFSHLQDSLGGPLLSLFYMSGISLFYYSGKTLKPLEWVGKMALTNYLLQSIISTLLFYHYGLSFYGEIEVTTGILLVIGIFLFQILFSRWWLLKFQYGPIEWIWRMGTYRTRFPLKKHQKGEIVYEND